MGYAVVAAVLAVLLFLASPMAFFAILIAGGVLFAGMTIYYSRFP